MTVEQTYLIRDKKVKVTIETWDGDTWRFDSIGELWGYRLFGDNSPYYMLFNNCGCLSGAFNYLSTEVFGANRRYYNCWRIPRPLTPSRDGVTLSFSPPDASNVRITTLLDAFELFKIANISIF